MKLTRRALLTAPLLAGCAGGGARAEATVTTRDELVEALARWGDRPKRIRVAARIDLAAGFRPPPFDAAAHLRAYDPATWGRRPPAGPLEDARRAAAAAQARHVTLRLPPNTTLEGAVPGAGFRGGMLLLDGVQHVRLRDLVFAEAIDLFPEWDPLDGAQGEWNAAYDQLALRRSEHVQIEHCDFLGGAPFSEQAFDRTLMRHDGALDITRASDHVEVAWCRFLNHDKTMLIGGSDRHTEDAGRLHVHLHHNLWQACRERTPRVRYGRVHLWENLFVVERAEDYGYSLGLGHRATVFSERNAWALPPGLDPARVLRRLGDGAVADRGSTVNGRPLAPPGGPAPEGEPPAVAHPLPVSQVAAAVRAGAGAHRRQSL